MRRGRFRHVVEISLLKAVQPHLLIAFLRPFSAELNSAGLALPDTPSVRWLEDLCSMLNRDDTALPGALQAALVDVAILATPVGHEQITTLAEERGITLVSADATIPQEDLAFLVYVEQRELFRAARSRVKSFEPRLFVHFHGPGTGIHATDRSVTARLSILKERLSSWLQKRNRTGA
jgi:hypothetical protein